MKTGTRSAGNGGRCEYRGERAEETTSWDISSCSLLLRSPAPAPVVPSWRRHTSCYRVGVECGYLASPVPQCPLPTSPAPLCPPPVALGAAVCWEVTSLGLTLRLLAAGLSQHILRHLPLSSTGQSSGTNPRYIWPGHQGALGSLGTTFAL